MSVSIFDLFSIGIGPSSSHTVGPMKAAREFVLHLQKSQQLKDVARITVELYGSLALTGRGHGTDKAILNGLVGEAPETTIPEQMIPRMNQIISQAKIRLAGVFVLASLS